jgi:hypothetical protein
MVVLTGTRTGRTAVCTCGLAISEWDFGTRHPIWSHDDLTERPDFCPGWRLAEPTSGSIKETA